MPRFSYMIIEFNHFLVFFSLFLLKLLQALNHHMMIYPTHSAKNHNNIHLPEILNHNHIADEYRWYKTLDFFMTLFSHSGFGQIRTTNYGIHEFILCVDRGIIASKISTSTIFFSLDIEKNDSMMPLSTQRRVSCGYG